MFFAVEIDAYRPGAAGFGAPMADAWSALPWGSLEFLQGAIESTVTLRASDAGYRTPPASGRVTFRGGRVTFRGEAVRFRASGAAGEVLVFPPFLQGAFSIDRRVNLDPSTSAAAAGWGSVQLDNSAGRYDDLAATFNSDGRAVRVLIGAKQFDPARGLYLDPPRAALSTVFAGVATPWFAGDTTLDVPIRDASYWLERPAQSGLYGGTGGLDGSTDLKGLPRPKTRGTARNVTPVLVDPVRLVYQWTDGPGKLQAVYEGGATGIVFQSNVANLYAGTTAPGRYRTDETRGLFQLGSSPVRAITADVSGGPVGTAALVALDLLTSDLGVPPEMVDAASFAAVDAAAPYRAGFYTGTTQTDGARLAGDVLASIGARLIPTRDGRLRAILLRALPDAAPAAVTLHRGNAVSLTPRAIGAPLDPPPFRWQVGYARAWTVQTSDLNGSITPDRKAFVAAADRFAVWASTDVLQAYRRPNDPPQLRTLLADEAAALVIANSLGDIWGVRRRLYDVVVPVAIGLPLDLGSVVRLDWPADNLRGGRAGQVVGEQFRAGDATITLQVLV